MKALYDKVCLRNSKMITHAYSTSFSLGTRFLGTKFQNPIYAIYGFVRFADEIVDTFHDFDKAHLLQKFTQDTYEAIDQGISLNPVLNSFQQVVKEYDIDRELIDTFLESMRMDLEKTAYSKDGYEKYILGSAEVVGLMCLKVFTEGDRDMYRKLEYPAMRLGAAFQKINFLRDLKDDFEGLGRTYFPGVDMDTFDDNTKKAIEDEIGRDFAEGYAGILQLPKAARFGVYMAYVYFYRLFLKIQNTPAKEIMQSRIRIPDNKKYALFIESYVKHSFNMI